MSKKINQVGIDVSASELVVEMKLVSQNARVQGVFDNTRVGHKKLLKFITKNDRYAKVCMEATGIYHFELATMLAQSDKVSVMIVNPKAMKHFGTAMLQRAKTDKVDAHIILEYLLRMDFVKWSAPNDNILQIQALSRRLFQLKKEIAREQNRLDSVNFRGKIGEIISETIAQHIQQLKKHINDIQQQISMVIKEDRVFRILCCH